MLQTSGQQHHLHQQQSYQYLSQQQQLQQQQHQQHQYPVENRGAFKKDEGFENLSFDKFERVPETTHVDYGAGYQKHSQPVRSQRNLTTDPVELSNQATMRTNYFQPHHPVTMNSNSGISTGKVSTNSATGSHYWNEGAALLNNDIPSVNNANPNNNPNNFVKGASRNTAAKPTKEFTDSNFHHHQQQQQQQQQHGFSPIDRYHSNGSPQLSDSQNFEQSEHAKSALKRFYKEFRMVERDSVEHAEAYANKAKEWIPISETWRIDLELAEIAKRKKDFGKV